MGFASFFTDLSSEMIYPLLPIFLSTVLSATTIELGIIEGIAESTASLIKVFSGIWTDRAQKRKPFIVFGYSISAFFRPLIGLAPSWQSVLLLRFFDRVGKGIRTSPRDTMIADVTPSESRGAAYGLHRAMDHAGAVMGPLLAGGLLLIHGMQLRSVFLLAALPGIVTIAVLVFFLGEPKRSTPSAPNISKLNLRQDWKKLGRNFHIFLFALILFSLGNSTDAFLLVRLSQAGTPNAWIAILWSLFHVVKMTTSFFGGRLADHVDRKLMILAGWIFYALIYFAFSRAESLNALVVIFLSYGCYYGLTEPSERAFVSDLIPSHLRGTAFGYYHFCVGIAALPASILFGILWKYLGAPTAFLWGAALALLASLILVPLKKIQV